MESTLVFSLLIAVVLGADSFVCPDNESTGKFADPDQCDVYWDCYRGEPEEKYCKDGFAFDPRRVRLAEPCDYLFNVDCSGRDQLFDPLGSGVCHRRNGIYKHEDPDVCDRYYSCTDDVPTLVLCSPGLHFNVDTNACDWPLAANRGNCNRLTVVDGFQCDPTKEYFTKYNQKIAHPNFPHPDDCQKFYTCKNGVEPQVFGCDEGLVFSETLSACDIPENVPECADWFSTPEEEPYKAE